MRTTTVTCDCCKQPIKSDAFSVDIKRGNNSMFINPPDICRACMKKGFTVSMDANVETTFKILNDEVPDPAPI